MRRLGAVLAVLALVAGCGGGGDDGDGGDGGLASALDRIAGTPAMRAAITFSDMAGIREAGGFEADERRDDAFTHWVRAYGVGAGRLFGSSLALEEASGFDVLAADEAVTVGVPLDLAVAVRGDDLDVDALVEALREAGAEEESVDGVDLLRLAEDNRPTPGGGLDVSGLLNDLNVVIAEDGRVVASPNATSALAAASAGDESLADDPDVAAAVACLGDVLAAHVLPDADDARLIHVDVLVVDGTESEVLCLVGDEGDEDGLAARIEGSLDPERELASTRQPVGELFDAPDVTTGSERDRSWARGVVALREERPVGVLFQLLVNREL